MPNDIIYHEREIILAQLAPLKMRAKEDNLVFRYQGLLGIYEFTADQLEEQNQKGSFVWGAINWTLIPYKKSIQYRETQINLDF